MHQIFAHIFNQTIIFINRILSQIPSKIDMNSGKRAIAGTDITELKVIVNNPGKPTHSKYIVEIIEIRPSAVSITFIFE